MTHRIESAVFCIEAAFMRAYSSVELFRDRIEIFVFCAVDTILMCVCISFWSRTKKHIFIVSLSLLRCFDLPTKGSLKEELGHLTAGLSKLEEASATVDDLSKNAAKKQKELQAAQVIFFKR